MRGVSDETLAAFAVDEPLGEPFEQAGETHMQIMGEGHLIVGGPPGPAQRGPDLHRRARLGILDVLRHFVIGVGYRGDRPQEPGLARGVQPVLSLQICNPV